MMKRSALVVLSAAALFFPAVAGWGQTPIDKLTILKTPGWQEIYDAYEPDAESLNLLRERVRDLKIDVYLGTWCIDSKNHIPVFLKILDRANLPGLEVNFFSVEHKEKPGVKYYVEQRDVERVPTFIFLKGGDEIGRIIETPRKSILEDMLELIR